VPGRSHLTPIAVFLLAIGIAGVFLTGCKTREEEEREQARLDSLRQDSLRPVNNPYKFGQGNDQYNRQREALGNLDSLSSVPQPAVPNR